MYFYFLRQLPWPFKAASSSPGISDAYTRAGTVTQTQCLAGGGGGEGVHGLLLICRQWWKLQVCTRTALGAETWGAFMPWVEMTALVPEVLTDLVCIVLQRVMRVSLNHIFDYISARHRTPQWLEVAPFAPAVDEKCGTWLITLLHGAEDDFPWKDRKVLRCLMITWHEWGRIELFIRSKTWVPWLG